MAGLPLQRLLYVSMLAGRRGRILTVAPADCGLDFSALSYLVGDSLHLQWSQVTAATIRSQAGCPVVPLYGLLDVPLWLDGHIPTEGLIYLIAGQQSILAMDAGDFWRVNAHARVANFVRPMPARDPKVSDVEMGYVSWQSDTAYYWIDLTVDASVADVCRQ